MAHRGRLNVLTSWARAPNFIFRNSTTPCRREMFQAAAMNITRLPRDVETSAGRKVHLSLCFNQATSSS